MSIDADGRKYTSPDGSKTWEYLAILTCNYKIILLFDIFLNSKEKCLLKTWNEKLHIPLTVILYSDNFFLNLKNSVNDKKNNIGQKVTKKKKKKNAAS